MPLTLFTLSVLFLVFIRVFSTLRLVPFLNGFVLPISVSGGISIVVTFFLFPVFIKTLDFFHSLDLFTFILMVLFEFVTGTSLGIIISILWSIFSISGQIIDNIVFFYKHGIIQNSYSQLYLTVGTVVFILLQGEHLVFSAIYKCFLIIPLGGAVLGFVQHAFLEQLIKFIAGSFATGVMIAAPMMVASLFSALVLNILGKIMEGSDRFSDLFKPFEFVFFQFIIVAVLWKSVIWGTDFMISNINTL